MGSASIQGELWGARAKDWTELGEPVSVPAFEAVFDRAGVKRGTKLLDLGCGAGGALALARDRGAVVAGLDAAANLVAIARDRLPGARILRGDLEELPFADREFDVVTGFNSFQFAGDIVQALREARRVCKPGGSVTILCWGPKERCESVTSSMAAVAALLPPPPANGSRPLSEPGVVEGLMQKAGLAPVARGEVECPFAWPDVATATRCMLSAGLIVRAVQEVGESAVRQALEPTFAPFRRTDGTILQRNIFQWVMGGPVQ
jgi:SAM-dependent methyltransferase